MDTVRIILQLIIGLGIFNVWVLRAKKPTPYRGKDSKSLKEEFSAYGLPAWFFYLVGVVKLAAGSALIAGIWVPVLVQISSLVIALMMVGAALVHLRALDPVKKMVPSFLMLVMSVFVFFFA